jgi:hypothetical protein
MFFLNKGEKFINVYSNNFDDEIALVVMDQQKILQNRCKTVVDFDSTNLRLLRPIYLTMFFCFCIIVFRANL